MRKMLSAATLAVVLAVPGMASADDKSFLKKAIQGNYAEIAMGELGKSKGQSNDVKAYGDMLVKDHGDANTKAIGIAKDMKLDAPKSATAKQMKDHDKLAKLSGDAFDKAFIKHMVADHKKDIADYKKASKPAKGAVADYATNSLPVLQQHLDKAQALSK